MQSKSRIAILRIILIYVFFSAAWIFLSDRLLTILIPDIQGLTTAQTYKGWLFVLLSAALIATLLIREHDKQQNTEMQLINSQESFTSLFSMTAMPTLVYDPRTLQIMAANPSAIHQYGYSHDELLGMPITRLSDPSLGEQEPPISNQSPAEPLPIATTHFTNDGRALRVEILTQPVFFGGNKAVLLTARDITEEEATREAQQAAQEERQQVEAAAREHQARLHAAIESIPYEFWMMDCDGRYSLQNSACTARWGDLIGKKNSELSLPDELRRKWEAHDQRAFQGELVHVEMVETSPQGETRDVLAVVGPIFDHDQVQGILGINIDITPLKLRERELQIMVNVANSLRAIDSRADIETTLLAQVSDLFHLNAAALVHKALDQDEIIFDRGTGAWEYLTGQHLNANDPCAQFLQSSEGIHSIDVEPSIPQALIPLTGERVKSAVCIPLISDDRHKAGLWIGRREAFTPNETHLLSGVTDIAANALQRIRYAGQKEIHLQRLSALRSIDLAISASLDIHLTLNILLNQVVSQLNVDAADVLLYSPESQTLQFGASRGFRFADLRSTQLRLGESHAGKVALERRIEFVQDLTKLDDLLVDGLKQAGEQFRSYVGVPLISKGEIQGVLEMFSLGLLYPDQDWFDFVDGVAAQAAIAVDNATLFDRTQRSITDLMVAYDATIEGWARVLEIREREPEGHTRRVTEWTLRLARKAGFSEDLLIQVRRGVFLHDIGKMAIPESILLKPDNLTDDEWQVMKRHPEYAYEMLSPILYLRPALDIPYCHHERWDGKGYPRGLKKDQIPMAARLFSVVDVWDALSNQRPNRDAWPEIKILSYIREQSGKMFDPEVVSLFLMYYDQEMHQHPRK